MSWSWSNGRTQRRREERFVCSRSNHHNVPDHRKVKYDNRFCVVLLDFNAGQGRTMVVHCYSRKPREGEQLGFAPELYLTSVPIETAWGINARQLGMSLGNGEDQCEASTVESKGLRVDSRAGQKHETRALLS